MAHAKGFCQVKKNQRKTRKWVGGSSPNSGFFLFLNLYVFLCFCVVFMFPIVSKKKKIIDSGVGDVY